MTDTAQKLRKPRRDWRGWIFVGPFLFFFLIVFVAPLVYAIYLSFFQPKMVWGVSQGEQFVGFDNYTKLFADPNFWSGVIGVSLFLLIQGPDHAADLDVPGACHRLGPDLGSELLPRLRVHALRHPGGRGHPDVGFMYGTRYGVMGEVNSLLGTDIDVFSPSLIWVGIGNIVTWQFIGYNMLIFYSALKTIPTSLYEAAAIDGASEWNVIRAIKLPAIRGSMMIAVIFSVIGTFQLFNEPNVLPQMAGSTITTYFTPNFYAFHLAFEANNPSYSATLAIVMGVITVGVAYVVQLWGAKGGVK